MLVTGVAFLWTSAYEIWLGKGLSAFLRMRIVNPPTAGSSDVA